MVLPLIGALAGAGGSIGAALLGADAQENASLWNWYINEQNLRDQRKARQQSIDFANEIRGEQKLGGTDALGNRTYFKEGEGWRTDLSPEQQELYDYFFNQELPERRSQFQRSAGQSRQNADQANQLLDEFSRVRRQDPAEAEAQLYMLASRGIREGARDTTEAATRQGMRTGNTNIGDLIAKVGKEAMTQRRDARVNASLQSEDYVNDKYNSERSGLANLYQMFLGNSRADLGTSYDPTGLPGQATQLTTALGSMGQSGNSGALQAMMQPMPIRQNIEPNMGYANAAGAIGASLSGLGDRMGSMSEKSDMNALLKQYITSGGQLGLGNGGLFGRTADRLAYNRSSF